MHPGHPRTTEGDRMTSLFSPYRWLAALAMLAGLVLGYGFWADHIGDTREAKVRAEYTATALVAEQAARAKEQALQTQIEKAQHDAKIREKKLAADAAAARGAADSLRDDLKTARSRLSQATRPALIEYSDASSELLIDCSRRYQELAVKADGHASDAVMLLEAWPRD